MSESAPTSRLINVPILTRVEGEGALHVRLHGNKIEDVQLKIYEPPRFFEALLRGKPMDDVADITSRICGICPIAYQMTAVQALETIQGIPIDPEIASLRRLMYCGEWIESHVLHIHMLHAPDFFDCSSAIELAKRFPVEVKRGLKLKQIGNRLLEVLGGRAIHPVNLAIGGYYRLPRRDELTSLIADFEWGLQHSIEAANWLGGLTFPDFEGSYEFVALSRPDRYAIESGSIASSKHAAIPVEAYEDFFYEMQVPHSTALQARKRPTDSTYFVGPLARIYLNYETLTPLAKRTAEMIGMTPPCHNPHKSILARAVETVFAFEEGLEILKSLSFPARSRVPYEVRAGEGVSATEAPRGLIFHRYRVDHHGKIEFAKIVPPTSQNQAQIEADLRSLLPRLIAFEDAKIAIDCERLVRTYDPCISCSTHFLKLHIERT
ncbi:MAG: Ni/Fe hydrogenase subunit alpha [Planctomycetota bacterium]